MAFEELDLYRFDAAAGLWRPAPAPGAMDIDEDADEDADEPERDLWPNPVRAEGDLPGELTVVTYNVWFDALEQTRRWRALLAEVERCDADVIAFQEVTRPFLAMLGEEPWIRAGYTLSDLPCLTFAHYGVVLCSRLPIRRLTQHDMPSRMGRTLLVAELAGSLAVATIHLESLKPSRRYRDTQFAICELILSAFDHAVLCGDMNFCSSWPEENARVPAHYTDVWPAVHPDDPGYTEDSYVNEMLHVYEQEHKQVRYDRVFLHSKDASLQPVAIERLGTRPIADDPLLFPSDHFGLCARLARRPVGDEPAS